MPVNTSWGEAFMAVQQGVADGLESAITELAAIRVNEIVKFVAETNHMQGSVPIVVNETWFNKLTRDQQDAIIRAGKDVTEYRVGTLAKEEERSWQIFKDSGVQVLRANEIDMAAFVAACKDIPREFIARGYFTQELLDSIINTR